MGNGLSGNKKGKKILKEIKQKMKDSQSSKNNSILKK
jgi:hypothetical protein